MVCYLKITDCIFNIHYLGRNSNKYTKVYQIYMWIHADNTLICFRNTIEAIHASTYPVLIGSSQDTKVTVARLFVNVKCTLSILVKCCQTKLVLIQNVLFGSRQSWTKPAFSWQRHVKRTCGVHRNTLQQKAGEPQLLNCYLYFSIKVVGKLLTCAFQSYQSISNTIKYPSPYVLWS